MNEPYALSKLIVGDGYEYTHVDVVKKGICISIKQTTGETTSITVVEDGLCTTFERTANSWIWNKPVYLTSKHNDVAALLLEQGIMSTFDQFLEQANSYADQHKEMEVTIMEGAPNVVEIIRSQYSVTVDFDNKVIRVLNYYGDPLAIVGFDPEGIHFTPSGIRTSSLSVNTVILT